MNKEKCKIGDTHFVSPPRKCAPNLWREDAKYVKDSLENLESKQRKEPTWGIPGANLRWN